MARSLKKQALVLMAGNGYTRALGFGLHLLFARLMGPEALGVMELAHSAAMLALTPVTAGVSTAMSRLTAGRAKADRLSVLRAGVGLNLRISLILMPCLLLLSPAVAWLLGDMRTLPSILADIPTILLLGLCSVYGGYCYGLEDTLTPALNECAEQTLRFLLSMGLLVVFSSADVSVAAALPEAAELLAATVALLLFRRAVHMPRSLAKPSAALQRELWRLCVPMMFSRLCLTGMRTLNAVLLPACLRRSGLSASAAMAQFGLLNGMAMPLLMLPGVITGAVCMVSTPAVARLETSPARLRLMMRQLSLSAAGIGALAMLTIGLGADFISLRLYSQPALAPLLRLMSPLCVVQSLHQVTGGMIAGLGLQRKALTGTLLSSSVTLILTALLAPIGQLRLFGAAVASMVGQFLALCWNGFILLSFLINLGKEFSKSP